jgi:hypothetical protein
MSVDSPSTMNAGVIPKTGSASSVRPDTATHVPRFCSETLTCSALTSAGSTAVTSTSKLGPASDSRVSVCVPSAAARKM